MARSSQGFSGNRLTFLSPEELEEASRLLQPPARAPTGDTREGLVWQHEAVSQFLSNKILLKFRAHPLWSAAHPVLLGSWGRGELTPKSDLDLLFAGPEGTVLSLITDLQSQGYRIRYRLPEDPKDWSVGVETTDWLSLWRAQGETPWVREELRRQQERLFKSAGARRRILKDLWRERRERARRFDSIESFLEPQIKFGAGGLRDLFQGEVIQDLFADRFQDAGHERQLLQYYRHFFLTLRQKLHLDGFSDVLVASEQFDLASWFGYQQNSEFMRQIQRGLSRVHFYSEWALLKAQTSPAKWAALERKIFRNAPSLLTQLIKDPSILSQYRVRSCMDRFSFSVADRGRMLRQLLSPEIGDASLQAVFRSRLIDKICPRMVHLVGLVQHDQYHRFTADAHLLQACREVLKARRQPKILGVLKVLSFKMSATDWKILSWAALYHDLAKGLPGDHSEVGEEWVLRDLKSFGFPLSFRKEVAWLVKNHLQLSIAAFRQNPQSPQTWQRLQDLELNEKRLWRLALWTALDIRATNPEAWNDWKAKLVLNLVEKLSAGGTQNFLKLKKKVPRGLSPQVVDALDPQLFESFSAEKLQADLEKVTRDQNPWVVLLDINKKIWIRFHQQEDRAGLLAELLEKIYASGASIQHALIHTLPEIGVYDWFQVQTQRDPSSLLKRLTQMQSSARSAPKVQFMSIDLVSQSENEWVLSFRGVDQKGLLLAAALRLKELGAQIKSARVHTWGRQIEDLFEIEPLATLDGGGESFLQQLRVSLMS